VRNQKLVNNQGWTIFYKSHGQQLHQVPPTKVHHQPYSYAYVPQIAFVMRVGRLHVVCTKFEVEVRFNNNLRVPRSKNFDLYIHSPICHHDVALNELRTGTNLWMYI
jgi:hypothetical protein